MTANSSGNPDIVNPEMKLEDVREGIDANTCEGRGRETASGRGYNAERLANAIFSELGLINRWSVQPHVDAYIRGEVPYYIEVKSCVNRYQSSNKELGRYGQFRIWWPHHNRLQAENSVYDSRTAIYFFVVYAVIDGIEKEVGKLIVPVEKIDDVLDRWSLEDHVTMGEQRCRQISWHLLLKRLGVSIDEFKSEDIIDLTDE
ncbi:hypothetical protein EXE46_05980 [Halorubrum sp. GN11_10-6_MGM]|uniref:hypothetical protein n=1 Tax=Halorubrum sp. GN11_10-6_MGM TaxID=2518112 RepID=UPI0010F6EE65|nr:hypothetical protein [Halorubrum sp. GN11_10-6_MGM]TKX74961.1 hypothetical protein EXE46_05980 [Halorubrum sp. GN11_10-6_MGM]